MHKLVASSAALVLLLTFCSCDHNIYEISMRTNGDVLERTVTVYRVKESNAQPASGTSQATTLPVIGTSHEMTTPTTSRAQLPNDQLDAIQKIYGKPVSSDADGTRTFAGRFAGRTPQDIGGSGHYVQYESDMGCAKVYTERFRGTDDLAAIIERQSKSADAITDILIAWAKTEMKGEPRLDKLVAFLDGQFRHDLKSLALYTFVAGTNRPVSTQATTQPLITNYQELAARGLQYLADRDYLQPSDWSQVQGGLFGNARIGVVTMALVRKIAMEKMGVPSNEPTTKSLSFLATTQSATKSLEGYLAATPQYKQILTKWETTTKSATAPSSQPTPPTPWAVLDAQNATLIQLNLPDPADDEVHISLITTSQPYATNGEYEPSAGRVSWAFTLKPDEKDTYAPFCFAYWGEPHEAFQKAHLGAVALKGESLVKYCEWYKCLTPQELKRWEEFAKTLTPGPDLPGRLRQFLLHPENASPALPGQAATAQSKDAATETMEMLAKAVEESAATQPAPASGPIRAPGPTPR